MTRLTPKELGAELRRNRRFVYAMKAQGFPMPGGMATVDDALAWLKVHPHPRSQKKRRRVLSRPISS